MVHRIDWRVADPAAQAFWEQRLADLDVPTRRAGEALVFADPEGLTHALIADPASDPALAARAPDVPAEHALRGFAGVRAFSAAPEASRTVLSEALGLTPDAPGDGATAAAWRSADPRPARLGYDPPPHPPGLQGAGSVHHVAWAVDDDDHLRAVRGRAADAGSHPTEVIDRQYFHSVYFREPSGVLFELATAGPGFAIDEPASELGERLALPPQYEPLREQLEQRLTPLTNPRSAPARG
jgi:glyoxalase family protein